MNNPCYCCGTFVLPANAKRATCPECGKRKPIDQFFLTGWQGRLQCDQCQVRERGFDPESSKGLSALAGIRKDREAMERDRKTRAHQAHD